MMRTALLLAGMTALFLGAGFLLGGQGGMVIALGLAAAMNLFADWNSDRLVLSLHGASEIDAGTAPAYYGAVKALAASAGLPMPRVYVVKKDQPNAFATGRNPANASVAATTGLLRLLPVQELAGMMAHELAHIRNRDTLVMTITAAIAGAVSMLSNFGLFFRRQPEQSAGDRGLDPRHDRGAARGHAGAGSDFQNPRICRGSGGRGDLRQSPVACPRPGAAGGVCGPDPQPPRRELPGNSTPVHRQSTPARFHRSPVLNPSEDRGSCLSTLDDGGGCACHDAIPAVLRCSSPIRESAPRDAASALAVGSAFSRSLRCCECFSRGAAPLLQARMAELGFHLASVWGHGIDAARALTSVEGSAYARNREKDMRIALLGCGRIGRMHAGNLARHHGVSLAIVHDIHRPSAEDVAASHGVPIARSAEEIFSSPDADAVLVASTTETHVGYIEMAVASGKPVLCEKPIDLDLARVNTCAERIAGTTVPIQIGFNRRFDPGHRAAWAATRNGEIGELHQVVITSRDPEMPPREYYESAGGLLRDMTIHDFDLARYMLDEEPEEVFAVAGRMIDRKLMDELDDFDTVMIILRTASGKQCHINNSRTAVYGYDQRVELLGTEGMLQSGNRKPHEMHRFTGTRVEAGEPYLYFFIERYQEAFMAEIDGFLESIRTGSTPKPGFEDGRQALRLAEAAYISIREKRIARMEEIE